MPLDTRLMVGFFRHYHKMSIAYLNIMGPNNIVPDMRMEEMPFTTSYFQISKI